MFALFSNSHNLFYLKDTFRLCNLKNSISCTFFFPTRLGVFFSPTLLKEPECKSHPFRFNALTIEVVMAFTWQFGTQSTLSRAMICKRHASCLCISLQSARPSQTCICFLFGLLCHQIRILTAGPSKKSLSSAKNAPNLHKHS